jgi:hypothetical protein
LRVAKKFNDDGRARRTRAGLAAAGLSVALISPSTGRSRQDAARSNILLAENICLLPMIKRFDPQQAVRHGGYLLLLVEVTQSGRGVGCRDNGTREVSMTYAG